MTDRYRSLAGEVYEAIVRTVHPDDTFDVDIVVPGTEARVSLTKIQRGTAPGQLLEGLTNGDTGKQAGHAAVRGS